MLVFVYSGFGCLFSRVGYNRASPLIDGNQKLGMVEGQIGVGFDGGTGDWLRVDMAWMGCSVKFLIRYPG